LIPLFNTMENHCLWIYENVIKKYSNHSEIYIVGHSMGGKCVIDLINSYPEDLLNGKIFKIALTDSVHGNSFRKLGSKVKKCLQKVIYLIIKDLHQFRYFKPKRGYFSQ